MLCGRSMISHSALLCEVYCILVESWVLMDQNAKVLFCDQELEVVLGSRGDRNVERIESCGELGQDSRSAVQKLCHQRCRSDTRS